MEVYSRSGRFEDDGEVVCLLSKVYSQARMLTGEEGADIQLQDWDEGCWCWMQSISGSTCCLLVLTFNSFILHVFKCMCCGLVKKFMATDDLYSLFFFSFLLFFKMLLS